MISTICLLWLFGIFCTSETKNVSDSVIEFKCPLSRTPISFEKYSSNVANSSKNSNDHWTTCLLPDYSCAKVHVPAVGHLFACLPDFGDIQPAFFYYFEPKKVHKVTLENYFSLSKGCDSLGRNITQKFITTVTYSNLSFVTEILCCKGEECSGENWMNIWDDSEYKLGQYRPRNNIFWYTSISMTGTLFCFIIGKLSLLAYQHSKERLVLESLKTISRTLKEADDEDQIKRRSAIRKIFRLGRRRKRKTEVSSTDVTSQKTNSIQALIRSNNK